jgi:threonine dehydratase
MTVTIEDIELAQRRLAGIVKPTPLIRSATLERMLDADVRIKPENLQKTGSFKIRGAYNRVAALTGDEKARGVIAASAGNHGQALAYAARRAGVHATIVMPRAAAIAKILATRAYEPTLVLEGADYLGARAAAEKLCAGTGALFVDAYDDPHVVAGQGTIGLEIAAEFTPDVVFVAVGGGGLIAGVAAALAARLPACEVIAVEAAGAPQLTESLRRDSPVALDRPVDTIADGLAAGRIGRIPFELIRRHVRRVVRVDDFEIGEAVLLMLERLKLLAEGAGAAALAGALKIRDELRGKRVAVVVSGGNIDMNLLDRIIGYGLARLGRLFRLAIDLHDRPGELGKLLACVAEAGANVRTIAHDRERRDVAIGRARVILELETRGLDHIEMVRAQLIRAGYQLVRQTD